MKEKLPVIGKIPQQVLEELTYTRPGAKSRNVLVDPMHGVDVGIVRVGNRALVLTTDPVFIVRSTVGSGPRGSPSTSCCRTWSRAGFRPAIPGTVSLSEN